MVKKIIKTNPNLIELINKLNKKSKTENAAIWKDVANRLGRSNRRTAEVNLSDIARYANADETVLVPGKVLSNGDLTEKVNVAAFKFSQKAQEKIEELYQDKHQWAKMCLVNIAKSGYFSSDRTIGEYAEDIWNAEPLKF